MSLGVALVALGLVCRGRRPGEHSDDAVDVEVPDLLGGHAVVTQVPFKPGAQEAGTRSSQVSVSARPETL